MTYFSWKLWIKTIIFIDIFKRPQHWYKNTNKFYWNYKPYTTLWLTLIHLKNSSYWSFKRGQKNSPPFFDLKKNLDLDRVIYYLQLLPHFSGPYSEEKSKIWLGIPLGRSILFCARMRCVFHNVRMSLWQKKISFYIFFLFT